MSGTGTRSRPRGWHVLLAYLAGLPRLGVFLGGVVVMLLGLFLPGWAGAGVLLVVVAALAAVLTATWPRLPAARRGLQVLILLLVLALAAAKVV